MKQVNYRNQVKQLNQERVAMAATFFTAVAGWTVLAFEVGGKLLHPIIV
jgi:hypothetical protein